MGDNEKGRQIQSLVRAAEILKLFTGEHQSLGLKEMADELQLPKTTVQSLASTLLSLELLEKDRLNGNYRLGPMLFQLGMKYATNMDLVNQARVWMERLSYRFRQPVNVGMLVGGKPVVVMRVEPDRRFMVFPQVGSQIPVHSSSIGKQLYAWLDEEERHRYLRDYEYTPLTEKTITDEETFLEELARIRESWLSFDEGENIKGLAGIGGPLCNHDGAVIAAFVLTGDAGQIEAMRDEIIEEVRYTTRELSVQLGCERSRFEGIG